MLAALTPLNLQLQKELEQISILFPSNSSISVQMLLPSTPPRKCKVLQEKKSFKELGSKALKCLSLALYRKASTLSKTRNQERSWMMLSISKIK